MTWPEIWEGSSPRAIAFRGLLTPISWLYALGWLCYLGMYRLGLKKPAKSHSPVICVGNLVAGGSGKTPVAIYLARVLTDLGHEVVISASGYGGPHAEAAEIAPSGSLDPRVWGDEPAMLRDELPGVPLIVGRRRVLAAEICAAQFPEAILLMDDGFQHLPLAKDVSILVEPDGSNKRCLPAGPYREPRSSLKRADLVLSSDSRFRVRHGPLLPFERLVERSSPPVSGNSELTNVAEATGTLTPQPPLPPAQTSAGRGGVSVLCAIGNPEGFVKAIREAGYEIKGVRRLDDHDPLDDPNLFDGLQEPIVVTAKDAVKLRNRPEQILVARRETKIEPEGEFRIWLQEILTRTPELRNPRTLP